MYSLAVRVNTSMNLSVISLPLRSTILSISKAGAGFVRIARTGGPVAVVGPKFTVHSLHSSHFRSAGGVVSR